jgi:hypothetical protein
LFGYSRVVEKQSVQGLFKNVQLQGAQKIEPRGVYKHTLSGAVLQRNTANERIVKSIGFYRQGK